MATCVYLHYYLFILGTIKKISCFPSPTDPDLRADPTIFFILNFFLLIFFLLFLLFLFFYFFIHVYYMFILYMFISMNDIFNQYATKILKINPTLLGLRMACCHRSVSRGRVWLVK